MKIFFEETSYQPALLNHYFGSRHLQSIQRSVRDGSTRRVLKGVGYCYDAFGAEHVFVLPKNFVFANQKAFGVIPISDCFPIDDNEEMRTMMTKYGWSESLLSTLPVMLYQAIDRYRKQVQNSHSSETDFYQELVTSKKGDNELTLLDISLSLQQFYRDNQNLFLLVYKQSRSGFNKIQWEKTVRNTAPYIEKDVVYYPQIINRKKAINYDEELLVIFFNTLRFLNLKYQFHVVVEQPYNLMPDKEFERKLERGIILRRLKAIKNNYFNEGLVRLWDLLYAFTSKLSSIRKPSAKKDYLFARSFEKVFEKMVDTILSDTELPQDLKKQRDGKIIDHLFKGVSVTSEQLELYYIGDSKYYKTGNRPDDISKSKQYTYAKNIIQLELEWFNTNKKKTDVLKYRDELTEGYNLTPNFFISGKVEAGYSYDKDYLEPPKEDAFLDDHYQFKNRIFDRDTLFLMQFDVNLLFVVNAYVSRNQRIRVAFKETAAIRFRNEFINALEYRYEFYLMRIRDGKSLEEGIKEHFRDINGKVFCPYSAGEYYGLMIMGLRKDDFSKNMTLILSLQHDFVIKEYHLGTEPYHYYKGLLNGKESSRTLVLRDAMTKYYRESAIVMSYDSDEELDRIKNNARVSLSLHELEACCKGSYRQRIFTSAYLFLYDSRDTKRNATGFLLEGIQYYDKDTDKMSFELFPGTIGGELVLQPFIGRHTQGKNRGAFFLSFEEALDDYRPES